MAKIQANDNFTVMPYKNTKIIKVTFKPQYCPVDPKTDKIVDGFNSLKEAKAFLDKKGK